MTHILPVDRSYLILQRLQKLHNLLCELRLPAVGLPSNTAASLSSVLEMRISSFGVFVQVKAKCLHLITALEHFVTQFLN